MYQFQFNKLLFVRTNKNRFLSVQSIETSSVDS